MKKMHVLETDVLGAIELSNPGSGFAASDSIGDFISDWQIASRKNEKKILKAEFQEFKLEYLESFSKNFC